MSDETTIFRPGHKEPTGSHLFGVSIRGWLAVMLVTTVCCNHLGVTIATCYRAIATGDFTLIGTLTTIGEPLYSMGVAALGFYFGNQKSKST